MEIMASREQKRNVYKLLSGKCEAKRPFGNLTRRWDDAIKLDRK
jgi:hypothetical protein